MSSCLPKVVKPVEQMELQMVSLVPCQRGTILVWWQMSCRLLGRVKGV